MTLAWAGPISADFKSNNQSFYCDFFPLFILLLIVISRHDRTIPGMNALI